jgi:hypothetical protein
MDYEEDEEILKAYNSSKSYEHGRVKKILN